MEPGSLLAGLQHLGVLKLFGAAAAHAHQVVMVAVGIAGQLKAASPLRKLQLLQQAHRAQQAQGAVHRGQRHPLLTAQQALVHLFGTQMAALTDALEQGQHALALGGEPLATIVKAGAQAGLGGHHSIPGLLNNKHSCEGVPGGMLNNKLNNQWMRDKRF